MKVKLRIYEQNPSRTRTVTLDEGDIMKAFEAYMIIFDDIDASVAYEAEIEEVTI